MPPYADLPNYDRGDTDASSPRDVILTFDLPHTVAEVKQHSTAHTRFDARRLPDAFVFKLWCVLVPKSINESADASTSPSKFLVENREAFGNSLADDVLLVTKVKDDGTLDLGFAADVKRAMEYNEEELPALLFLR